LDKKQRPPPTTTTTTTTTTMTMAHETILFSFPSVSLAPPHSPNSIGLLVLSSSQQPTPFDPSRHDAFLRVQHTPDSLKTSHPTDVLIEAWRTLRKVSPREFVLASEFGELVITFPELHHLLPQNDARIEIPREVRCTMTWEAIVRSFETEIDRFVTYEKNEYSLLDEPFSQKGVPKYDPSAYGRPEDEKQQGGRVILVDEENGDEVGEVGGLNVSSIGVVPGSKDPVEITFPTEGETGPVTVSSPPHPQYPPLTGIGPSRTPRIPPRRLSPRLCLQHTRPNRRHCVPADRNDLILSFLRFNLGGPYLHRKNTPQRRPHHLPT
jgi:hypothetical protein